MFSFPNAAWSSFDIISSLFDWLVQARNQTTLDGFSLCNGYFVQNKAHILFSSYVCDAMMAKRHQECDEIDFSDINVLVMMGRYIQSKCT